MLFHPSDSFMLVKWVFWGWKNKNSFLKWSKKPSSFCAWHFAIRLCGLTQYFQEQFCRTPSPAYTLWSSAIGCFSWKMWASEVFHLFHLQVFLALKWRGFARNWVCHSIGRGRLPLWTLFAEKSETSIFGLLPGSLVESRFLQIMCFKSANSPASCSSPSLLEKLVEDWQRSFKRATFASSRFTFWKAICLMLKRKKNSKKLLPYLTLLLY